MRRYYIDTVIRQASQWQLETSQSPPSSALRGMHVTTRILPELQTQLDYVLYAGANSSVRDGPASSSCCSRSRQRRPCCASYVRDLGGALEAASAPVRTTIRPVRTTTIPMSRELLPHAPRSFHCRELYAHAPRVHRHPRLLNGDSLCDHCAAKTSASVTAKPWSITVLI
jgi:hypothetical protein